ncbi:MAG TPA: hypothetical protein VE377_07350 [Candidatus Dormibacteraeota bacterium]|nr:hypothetical protein [Candidatus Dormibacteraeota bacterium]
MNTKQFPILGLILAILFGPRAVNRGESPTPARRPAATVEKAQPPKESKGTAHPAPAAASDRCNDPRDLQRRWWLSRSAQGCSLVVSPVWKEICKINPRHPDDEALLDPNLKSEEFRRLCLGDAGPIRSMMAAVPNPQHTHLGLMTDRAIEAIHVAASEARFLPLAHYLPWPTSGSGGGAASASESQADSSTPGILVFQDIDTGATLRPKYLLVFLIPEMPTEGLDRGVFLNAGKIIAKASPGMKVIRLAGPNFSGSVASLGELQTGLQDLELEERRATNRPQNPQERPTPCIHAISGSVTNPGNVPANCLTFEVMQTKDSQALCQFVRSAHTFGYLSSEIAILSEAGTQYGMQSSKDQTAAEPGPATQGPDADGCYPNDRTSLWFLHFPREISKLRNAYGAEQGKTAASDSSASTELGMQWQDAEGSQRDDMQTYGDRQTPLSQEAVLSSLSITLKAQGIKALGILATDPMDEAFLIHSIKVSSPDVRLFVRDPDLLFLRTPDVGSLNGTLVVSNYPLIPANQFWSSTGEPSAEHQLITFPSAFQEGEYNAFVKLLEDKDENWTPANKTLKRLEWEWPAGMSANSQDTNNASAGNRPLWLAVIGTAGHYPIKVLNYQDVRRDELRLHSLNVGRPQLLPMTLWGAIAMLGLLQILGLCFSQAVPSMFKHDFDLSDKTSSVTLVKLLCHTMLILMIGLTQLIVGSSYLFFYDSKPGYRALALSIAITTAVLLAAAGVLLQKICVLARLQQRQKDAPEANQIMSPLRIVLSAIFSTAVMVGAGGLWCWMTLGNRFENTFLHFRNLNLSSGVAPTLPLAALLLVLYFGIWAYLRRLDYWQHRYVEMFNLELDPVIRQDFGPDFRAIDACLLGPLENGRWTIALLLVFGFSMFTLRPGSTLDMIEPSRVSTFVHWFIAFALLSLWLNWFRFVNVWVHLQKILDHLENLPLRTAFQRLPKEKSLPLLQWSASPNTFLLRQVLDRLRALAKADPIQENKDLEANFETRLESLMSHGAVKLAIVEKRVVGGSPWPGPPPRPARRREDHLFAARQEMTNVIQTLSDRLRNDYWRRGSSTEQDQKPDPADQKYLLAEDIVALPFHAYIRKVIQEMRNILFFLGVAVSLLFAALHTYAFRADQSIDWWFFGLFAVMGLGIVVVIAQVERNALVSRLTNSTPGELGTNFYVQLLKYGTVPILTIFGSQVPFISNVALKWVQPALQALR